MAACLMTFFIPFFWVLLPPSFRSISQRRVANPKANETKRVLSISTQLTSPQLTQLNTSLNCLSLSLSLCLRLCPVNWFPLAAAAAAAAVGRNFRFSSGRCTKLLIVGYAQVAPFPLCPFPPPPLSAQLICLAVADEVEFYDIFCTFRRGRATH